MSTNAPDTRRRQLDANDTQTVISGPDQLAGTLKDVIDPEGSAATESTSTASDVKAWLFQEGGEPRQVAVDELANLATDDASFVWVDLSDYGSSSIEHVAQQLELPEAAVRTALAGWQRPRLSVFDACFFVSVTVPRLELDAKRLLAGELDLFVGRNYLVSAHKHPLPFGDRVMARAVQNPELLKLDSAFLLSILIDELLVHYEDLTEGLEDEIEAMEERALNDTSDIFLEDLLQLKRFVFAVYRLASQHHAIVEAFLRPDFPLVGGDVIEPYFRDLDARLGRLLDGLGAAKETVVGAFDIYVSQVGHRANDIMKVLAIVSTVLLPATVILGFFGTSFEAPYFTTATGFIIMNASIIMVTVLALFLFYRWGWLKRASADRRAGAGARASRAHRSGTAGENA